VELARRHFTDGVVFVNGYGTTEISFVAQNHLPPDAPLDHAVVPIGRPLDGIEVVLLDGDGRPAAATGEILVVCQHVAVGYWRRPELTAERFVDVDGVRAYRTGDLGTRLPDGRLVFLGRTDRLVKIRGYRVELGEVEARLAALPGVAHAAVVARALAGGEKEILGYVVGNVDTALIRAELAARLPHFMVPRAVIAVDALPMGLTGKLDVVALPPPPEPSTTDAVEGEELEQTIATAWCQVLGLSGVDWYASFVELGGHSLHAALLQQKLERALGITLPLTTVFEFPTVAGLAKHLRGGVTGVDPAVARAADRMRRRREARR
jgi:acyl carrier protein